MLFLVLNDYEARSGVFEHDEAVFLLGLNNWSCNQLFHDFVGSSVDGLDPGVDVRPGNRGLHHVAPTSVKLNTFSGYGVFLKFKLKKIYLCILGNYSGQFYTCITVGA